MSTLQVLNVPAGPPLAELAAAASDERWPMLLDSGPTPSPAARWSLLVLDPVERLLAAARPGGSALRQVQAALERRWPGAGRPRPGAAGGELPGFAGGAVGWLSYELARELESLPVRARPDAEVPDLALGLYPFALAEEVATGRRLVVGRGTRPEAEAFREVVAGLAARATPLAPLPSAGAALRSSLPRGAYEAAVETARELIRDGEIYQVNLSQRFELPYAGRAEPLQAALARRFPAPYGALLRLPGLAVISSSPELFLRRRGERLECRPIKGTRPRSAEPTEDERLRAELEASPKEGAELAMIVDLVRNDLGRIARIGSVTVEQAAATEAWSTVWHRVAHVACAVDAGRGVAEVLEATFPPASVTGTPKLAACKVIEAIEPVRRHVYTG
ncbi:MAG TPA: anthranilate synthase component I family protein, partial [Planctomycetota bacterium]|nr:anthranilate synthase component I family protein [Planctomycetota bacterium]